MHAHGLLQQGLAGLQACQPLLQGLSFCLNLCISPVTYMLDLCRQAVSFLSYAFVKLDLQKSHLLSKGLSSISLPASRRMLSLHVFPEALKRLLLLSLAQHMESHFSHMSSDEE